MADEQQKRERTPTRYVVLVAQEDGLTFIRVADDAGGELVFEGHNRADALNDALSYLDESLHERWLYAIPESSFKGLRAKAPKPRRHSFETE